MSRYKGVSDDKVLASIFKNLPIELWHKIKEFKTKGRREYRVVLHGREGPTSGNFHQDVKLCDAKSVDVYVRETDHNYRIEWRKKNYQAIFDLRNEVEDLQKENTRLKNIVKAMDRRVGERRSQTSY